MTRLPQLKSITPARPSGLKVTGPKHEHIEQSRAHPQRGFNVPVQHCAFAPLPKTKLDAMNSHVGAIRACKYLYLHSVSEPEENSLRVVLHEAKVGGPPTAEQLAQEALPSVRELLAGSNAIVHGPGCQVFELVWPSYIGYSVENESYALPEPEESVGEGRLIVVYTESVYLRYLSKATLASADYPGPFKHWALCCLNHIVNVASVEEPAIMVSHGV